MVVSSRFTFNDSLLSSDKVLPAVDIDKKTRIGGFDLSLVRLELKTLEYYYFYASCFFYY